MFTTLSTSAILVLTFMYKLIKLVRVSKAMSCNTISMSILQANHEFQALTSNIHLQLKNSRQEVPVLKMITTNMLFLLELERFIQPINVTLHAWMQAVHKTQITSMQSHTIVFITKNLLISLKRVVWMLLQIINSWFWTVG